MNERRKRWQAPGYARFQRARLPQSVVGENQARWKRAYPGASRGTNMRPYFWLIKFFGAIVPRRLRADWRLEWEWALSCRETRLAEWDNLNWNTKLDLLQRSLGAAHDALLLQPRRMEDEMIQDLRYGVRRLRAQPGFTAVAVFCLALGIGANTAIFGLVQTALFRQLSVPEPGQIVELSRATEWSAISYPDFTYLRERSGDVLSGLAANAWMVTSFSDGTRSEVVVGSIVSGNYFDVLGVKPVLGRAFLPEEDRTPGTHPVAVI